MLDQPFLDTELIKKRCQQPFRSTMPADHPCNEVVERMMARLSIIKIQPKNILLVEHAPSAFKERLKSQYPAANVICVPCIDTLSGAAENHFDIVILYFSLLWAHEPILLLQQAARCLREEGLFLCASLGPDSGMELRKSFATVSEHVHVHPFSDMHHLGDAMLQCHLSDTVMDCERVVLAYDALETLVEDARDYHVFNAHARRFKGLFTPKQWHALQQAYVAYKANGYYPLTLEVVYGHGWKLASSAQEEQEVSISIDAIQRRS